jgi:hypothetical protein
MPRVDEINQSGALKGRKRCDGDLNVDKRPDLLRVRLGVWILNGRERGPVRPERGRKESQTSCTRRGGMTGWLLRPFRAPRWG